MKLKFSVNLEETPENIWKRIRTFRAVNQELFPVMRMTSPKEFTDKPFEDFPVDKYVFNSTILFLGFIPVEVSKIRLINIEKDTGFLENSRMLLAKNWIHRRTLTANGNSCVITDELEVTPVLTILVPLFYGFVNIVFPNRHRRLRKIFNK